MQPTIPHSPKQPLTPPVLSTPCPLCWAPPGTLCQRKPAGNHLARYQDAERRGVLGRADLVSVVGGLVVIAPRVIVPDPAVGALGTERAA